MEGEGQVESNCQSFHMPEKNWATGRKIWRGYINNKDKIRHMEISATTRGKENYEQLYDVGYTCLMSITYNPWGLIQDDERMGLVMRYISQGHDHGPRLAGICKHHHLSWGTGMAQTVVTITLTHSTGNVLVHLPRQVVSRTGSEERVGCPNHKGVLVAAGTKQRRQQLQHPT